MYQDASKNWSTKPIGGSPTAFVPGTDTAPMCTRQYMVYKKQDTNKIGVALADMPCAVDADGTLHPLEGSAMVKDSGYSLRVSDANWVSPGGEIRESSPVLYVTVDGVKHELQAKSETCKDMNY